MKADYPLTDRRFPYVNADRTNIAERFKSAGYVAPEQAAAEQELESRIEGAKRVLQRIQSCTEPVRRPLYLLRS